MPHPSSAGLRQLADFLDNCAEEGVPVMEQCFVHIGSPYSAIPFSQEQHRASCAGIAKRLSSKMIMPEKTGPYEDVRIETKFEGVEVWFRFLASAICEQITEMRPVTVWKCAGVEVTAPATAGY